MTPMGCVELAKYCLAKSWRVSFTRLANVVDSSSRRRWRVLVFMPREAATEPNVALAIGSNRVIVRRTALLSGSTSDGIDTRLNSLRAFWAIIGSACDAGIASELVGKE